MGARFRAGLDQLTDDMAWIPETRGRGLMQAFETVAPGGTEPAPQYASEMLEAAKAHKLLVGKGGLHGNVVRMAPMLNVTADEIDEGLEALRSAATSIS